MQGVDPAPLQFLDYTVKKEQRNRPCSLAVLQADQVTESGSVGLVIETAKAEDLGESLSLLLIKCEGLLSLHYIIINKSTNNHDTLKNKEFIS